MRNIPLIHVAPLLAAIAVAGCNSSNTETVNDTVGDPQAAELANAAAVELPPMLKASKTFRCKDNSLIYVDFMSDDKTVHLKSEKEGPATTLSAPEAGQPFTSEDGSKKLTGDATAVTYNGKACKAG